MTRAFDYSNQDMSANPLFAKLRNRFIDAENCTIGEIMLKRLKTTATSAQQTYRRAFVQNRISARRASII